MAFIKPSKKQDPALTPIPNIFFDDYMPKANPTYASVYLLGYRLFYHGVTEVSNRALAEKLNLLASDVRRAWLYWAEEKLVCLHNDDGEDYDVEFLPLAAVSAPPVKEEATAKRAAGSPVMAVRPDYNVDELTKQAESSDEVRRLFSVAEKLFGKPLHYTELNALLGFYDWMKMPIAVIEIMLEYCLSNGHKSWRYIEKVALDWTDNGIETAEAAEAYIHLYNGDYREIMKAFGQSRRDPTPKEVGFMKKWIAEYKMPVALITAACDRTVAQLGQPKFSYADTILTDWFEKDARTMEAVDALEESFRKGKMAEQTAKAEKRAAPAARPAKNRFNNYTGRTWDYEKLERLAQERLEKSLKS